MATIIKLQQANSFINLEHITEANIVSSNPEKGRKVRLTFAGGEGEHPLKRTYAGEDAERLIAILEYEKEVY